MAYIDEIIDRQISAIANRLSDVEAAYFTTAGNRLAQIYGKDNQQLAAYLYGLEYSDDIRKDMARVERQMNAAHRANIRDMGRLFNDVTAEVYDEGRELSQYTGNRLSPVTNYKQAASPLLMNAYRNYEVMARSNTLNDTYKKTVNRYINRLMTGEEENYPTALRKAVRELTAEGISTVNYKSGRSMRMDSAIRNSLMTEYTQIVQGVQEKLGEEIGSDAIEISAHAHSAEDHEDIQGRVFTLEEWDKLQNGQDARDVDLERYEAGEADYLGETFQIDRPIGMWNCRHISFPFILGVSVPSHSKEELERLEKQNEEGVEFHGKHYTLYEAEQEQRRLETAMRHERGNLNLLKEVRDVDPALEHNYQQSKARIKELNNEYKKLGTVLEPHAIRMKKERSYGGNPKWDNKISGFDYTKRDLFKTALVVDKNNNTPIGLAFQSHHPSNPTRDNTFTGRKTSDPSLNTESGLRHLQQILFSDKSVYKPRPDKVMYLPGRIKSVGVIDVRLPDGKGARWSIDGQHFYGLLSRYNQKI